MLESARLLSVTIAFLLSATIAFAQTGRLPQVTTSRTYTTEQLAAKLRPSTVVVVCLKKDKTSVMGAKVSL